VKQQEANRLQDQKEEIKEMLKNQKTLRINQKILKEQV